MGVSKRVWIYSRGHKIDSVPDCSWVVLPPYFDRTVTINVLFDRTFDTCINHNLSKAVWQAGCNAALIAKDKCCSLSGYLSSQACR